MAEDNTGNADPQIGDKGFVMPEILDTDDADAIKEKFSKLSEHTIGVKDSNKQLFERAKNAEGFKKQDDGSWVKTEKPKPVKPEAKKLETTDTLDYGALAFHNTKTDALKIEHADDVALLEKALEETGKDQKSVLESTWFMAELKAAQDKRAVESATPSGGRGTGGDAPSTKKEFWIAAGKLPPDTPENRELRIEVVNARMKIEGNRNKFADKAVIGG